MKNSVSAMQRTRRRGAPRGWAATAMEVGKGYLLKATRTARMWSNSKRRHGLFTILLPGARRNPLRFTPCNSLNSISSVSIVIIDGELATAAVAISACRATSVRTMRMRRLCADLWQHYVYMVILDATHGSLSLLARRTLVT